MTVRPASAAGASVKSLTLSLLQHGANIGMSAQQLAHLYEPYNRLGRENSSVDGVGIGLTVTRALVESGLASEDLTLELTENILMERLETALPVLTELLGV